ncbi:MAG: hypothetical protein DI535_20840 [Citrobacter freundii]|nr:MAG: hypothetical protein DI535_20840 [Citrobacter freundii]
MAIHGNAQIISEQELRYYADQLVARKILTPEGGEMLVKKINARDIEVDYASTVNEYSYTSTDPAKESILEFCSQAFATALLRRIDNLQKAEGHIKPEPTGRKAMTISFGDFIGHRELDKDYIDRNRSAAGLTLRRTLNDIREIGLIDDKIYDRCLKLINEMSINFEKDLLKIMSSESSAHRLYGFHKNEQIEYVNKLVTLGLIDQRAQQQLVDSYRDSSLKTIPEILAYSDLYVFVDLSKEDSSPAIIYRIIFDSVRRLIPSFEYSDLQTKIIEKKTATLTELELNLNFLAGGVRYEHKCFYGFEKPTKRGELREVPPVRIGEGFQKVVNQWLRDQSSLYRLYTITPQNYSSKREFLPPDQVGLLLLKEGEAEQVSKNSQMISSESYNTVLSRKNIDQLIDSFSANDFFKGLSGDEIDKAKRNALGSSVNTLSDFLSVFPGTIVQFDWEAGNLENPYEELTKKFAQATGGRVTVTGIKDEFRTGWKKAKKIKYGFVMDGKQYETQLAFEDDWLQPEFFDLFQRALSESAAGGKFYQCVYNGQEAGYIFLTGKQLEFINRSYPELLLEEN